MNVASQELSQELYELSGWSDTTKYWWLDDSHHITHPEWDSWELADHDMSGRGFPAYDLGYLLRKLLPEYPSLEYIELTGEEGWGMYGELQLFIAVTTLMPTPPKTQQPN